MGRHSSRRVNGFLIVIVLILPLCGAAVISFVPPAGPYLDVHVVGSSFRASSLPLLQGELVEFTEAHPLITHVQITDLDQDHEPDILACDARRHGVFWYVRRIEGDWREHRLGEVELLAPGHATVTDIDKDGDLDVLVAVLGDVYPTTSRVGRVVLLENLGEHRFEPRVLLDDLYRVADVQAADLDGDNDIDLVVADFGYEEGSILWLENRGNGQFYDHELLVAPGTIHVPLADFDADGDVDITAIVSQEAEDIWGFENLGGGKFKSRLLYDCLNFDLGSSGLVLTDLDQDNRPDLLLTAGDNLEIVHHCPQPQHGCIWFRNLGGWQFQPQRLANFGGVYGASVGDLDGDKDLDIVLASTFNDWHQPAAASLVWLENDGRQAFRVWQITDRPTHLATVACGDLNADGRADVVAGGLHLMGPYDHIGRITTWISKQGPSR